MVAGSMIIFSVSTSLACQSAFSLHSALCTPPMPMPMPMTILHQLLTTHQSFTLTTSHFSPIDVPLLKSPVVLRAVQPGAGAVKAYAGIHSLVGFRQRAISISKFRCRFINQRHPSHPPTAHSVPCQDHRSRSVGHGFSRWTGFQLGCWAALVLFRRMRAVDAGWWDGMGWERDHGCVPLALIFLLFFTSS